MKEIISTITGKGQVTIPAEVRRSLGVAPSDKVVWIINENGEATVRRIRYTISDLEGILPPLNRPHRDDFEDVIAEAREEQAARIVAGQ